MTRKIDIEKLGELTANILAHPDFRESKPLIKTSIETLHAKYGLNRAEIRNIPFRNVFLMQTDDNDHVTLLFEEISHQSIAFESNIKLPSQINKIHFSKCEIQNLDIDFHGDVLLSEIISFGEERLIKVNINCQNFKYIAQRDDESHPLGTEIENRRSIFINCQNSGMNIHCVAMNNRLIISGQYNDANFFGDAKEIRLNKITQSNDTYFDHDSANNGLSITDFKGKSIFYHGELIDNILIDNSTMELLQLECSKSESLEIKGTSIDSLEIQYFGLENKNASIQFSWDLSRFHRNKIGEMYSEGSEYSFTADVTDFGHLVFGDSTKLLIFQMQDSKVNSLHSDPSCFIRCHSANITNSNILFWEGLSRLDTKWPEIDKYSLEIQQKWLNFFVFAKQICLKSGDRSGLDLFQWKIQNLRLKTIANMSDRLVLIVYWLVSDFGRSLIRPLALLTFTFIISFFAHQALYVYVSAELLPPDKVEYASLVSKPLLSGLFPILLSVDVSLPWWHLIIVVAHSLVSGIAIFLFGFGLRNRAHF